MADKTAFVTGASRGIGKAIALRLARGGYDVAVTARSLEEGEEREHSSGMNRSDTSPLPGSLTTTAREIEALGRRALILQADLLDFASLEAAARRALGEWGRIDLVVHNGRYVGTGLKDFTLDTPVEILERHVRANGIAPFVLNQVFLPAMLEQGGGTMIYITSNAAYRRPFANVEKGGWGISYAMSKAAGHSIAGVLSKEYADRGLRAFNLEPGATLTERIAKEMARPGYDALVWESPELTAEAAYWLATAPEADALNGKSMQAKELCREHGLMQVD